MKLGSSLDIYAVPYKGFMGVKPRRESICQLGVFPLIKNTDINIHIEHSPVRDALVAFEHKSDGVEDYSETVRFRVIVTRDLIKHYMSRVRKHLEGNGLNASEKKTQEVRGVVFIGMLFRDFRDLVYLIILLSNIADFKCFQVRKVAAVQFGTKTVIDGCSISWAERPGLIDELGIAKIDLRELINFTLERDQEFKNIPTSPYMKALAFQSYLYSGGPRSTLNNLIWCLASIESILSPKGRSVRAQIEDRIKVLFQGHQQKAVLDKFKKLYEYRSNLTHGSLKIPFYLRDNINTLFLEMPFDDAEFAFALTARLIIICFERKTYELTFRLKLME